MLALLYRSGRIRRLATGAASLSVVVLAAVGPLFIGAPSNVQADHAPENEPHARLQALITKVTVLDDKVETGAAEIRFRFTLERVSLKCDAPSYVCPESADFTTRRTVNTDDVISVNRLVPEDDSLEFHAGDVLRFTVQATDRAVGFEPLVCPINSSALPRGGPAPLFFTPQFPQCNPPTGKGTTLGLRTIAFGEDKDVPWGRSSAPKIIETPNYRVEYIIQNGRLPDLTVSDMSTAAGLMSDGQQTELCAKVQNAGLTSAGGYTLRVSSGSQSTSQDLGGLASGASEKVCGFMLDAMSDSAEIQARADSNSSVKESDEYNNTRVKTLAALAPGPDLMVSEITIEGKDPDGKSDCDPGRNKIYALIRNNGNMSAGSSVARLRLDGREPKDDEEGVDTLDANSEILVDFSRQSLNPGLHTLKVTADAGRDVDEVDEDNNSLQVTIDCQTEETKPFGDD